jgi:uncharacterized repeat protein (TIGR03803 family)
LPKILEKPVVNDPVANCNAWFIGDQILYFAYSRRLVASETKCSADTTNSQPFARYSGSKQRPNMRAAMAATILAIGAVVSLCTGTQSAIASAPTIFVVHNLLQEEGYDPLGGIIRGGDGDFYGVTSSGGASNDGTIFKATPAGEVTVLHSFDGTDGAQLFGALVQGDSHTYYGAAYSGGAFNLGYIYKVTNDGAFSVIHSFTGQLDSASPQCTLVCGPSGNLYGTTYNGLVVSPTSAGTVFQITPSGVLTTLHTFIYSEGDNPESGLVLGPDGNFYGTTCNGGSDGCGTVFKMTPTGVVTILHSFGGSDGDTQRMAMAHSIRSRSVPTAICTEQ